MLTMILKSNHIISFKLQSLKYIYIYYECNNNIINIEKRSSTTNHNLGCETIENNENVLQNVANCRRNVSNFLCLTIYLLIRYTDFTSLANISKQCVPNVDK